jgi:type II secretory pathway component PulC
MQERNDAAKSVDRRAWVVRLAAAAVFVVSCGKTRPPPAEPRSTEPSSTPDAGGTAAVATDGPLPSRPGRLWRRDVVAAFSRGLGDLLSRVQVEPALGGGKFRGWRVVKLKSGDPLWQGVDLAPGDIVTAVNDRPIERPEQAYAAFQSLVVASELRVTYERAGVRRAIVYPIDDLDGGN